MGHEPSRTQLNTPMSQYQNRIRLLSQVTLRSVGVISGDLIYYYSLDSPAFRPLDQDMISSSSTETRKTQAPVAEPSDGKLTENAALVQNSETNQTIVSESMDIEAVDSDAVKGKTDTNAGAEEPSKESSVLEKRSRETLLLKKILLEESGNTCDLTIVVMTVHAAMLESGFSLFDHDSGMRFSFSDELLSTSLKYTLPALIRGNEPPSITETVCLKFQILGHMATVYGFFSAGSSVRQVCFDRRRYVHIVHLLMETLKSDEEDTMSIDREVVMCWKMIKDGIVTPLVIDLCYKTGLKLPPCFMCLPQELIRKILESLHGMYIARLACVSSEFRDLVSDNDLWKQKCLEECEDLVTEDNDGVNWKKRFSIHWRRRGFSPYRRLMAFHFPLKM